MSTKSTGVGTGLNAKNEQKLSKDLDEGEEQTRQVGHHYPGANADHARDDGELEVGLAQQQRSPH